MREQAELAERGAYDYDQQPASHWWMWVLFAGIALVSLSLSLSLIVSSCVDACVFGPPAHAITVALLDSRFLCALGAATWKCVYGRKRKTS